LIPGSISMRKRIIWVAALISSAFAVADATFAEFDEVPVTRWVEGGGARLKSLEDVRASWRSDLPFWCAPVRLPSAADDPVCCILVNDTLYPGIETSLTTKLVPALENDGFTVNVYRTIGGHPPDVRQFLINKYAEAGEGFTVIFVGDLPVAMFEIPSGWENGRPFPCDLYYMDLDGVWIDAGYNSGVYDAHVGEVKADIRFGRLTAGPLTYGTATEADLVNHYIDKNMAYRAGALRCQDRALCYVDDDWNPYGSEWNKNMRLAYPTTEAYYDPYTTWDADYEARLLDNYEFIQVCAHSNPVVHAFYRPGNLVSYTYMTEVYNIKPVALFYNLFACSNARFTETDYMAGWYTFMENDYGLASVGSTKSGSMLHFDDFYGPLGEEERLGEAFRYWFAKWADADGQNSRDWHYGMTLIGDPTLFIRADFIPVLVRHFSARKRGEGVLLEWDYERGAGVSGFNLFRVEDAGLSREKVNERLITGAPPLRFFDRDVSAPGRYAYELEVVLGGESYVAASADVDVDAAPTSIALSSPAPNPATRGTTFAYAVPDAGARLAVYDIAGRKVKEFAIEQAGAGQLMWNLEDGAGRRVPAGVYVVRLRAGSEAATASLVIAKP
jgi:hypothetical protein